VRTEIISPAAQQRRMLEARLGAIGTERLVLRHCVG
jgi:hypothetical protein